MEGLYKKVIRGHYPRIPSHFSSELSNVIRSLLQVTPNLRPNAEKLLQHPIIVRKINESHIYEVDEWIPQLLNTIKIPKNLHYLTDKLPKANYLPLKLRKVEKSQFIQTLDNYKANLNDAFLPKINNIQLDENVQNSIVNQSVLQNQKVVKKTKKKYNLLNSNSQQNANVQQKSPIKMSIFDLEEGSKQQLVKNKHVQNQKQGINCLKLPKIDNQLHLSGEKNDILKQNNMGEDKIRELEKVYRGETKEKHKSLKKLDLLQRKNIQKKQNVIDEILI
ncbi:protein kinase domain protein [Ichthyophthirius multifiliis]|uniref:Protein kinase domain protein n=1 Tax=Ichthyophthirius multifiliis TaxID=5932 RepID=G0QJ85_ICHMU|nr:protein kinase domain protein [Ichthyophthirius multifiliis]EGR34714.1 protein kinase domain protein [Ichthyophthirius multifiliis]|eukprot:XP_004040018.1 protein kinase domain protein [Ichthyophthirius multifiliis]